MAFTATKDLMLPATVTGSWPRPRWYTMSMWGRPLDTAMMDPWYREQFTDAHAVVVSDQERCGLDILTTGDYPGDGKPKPVVFPDPSEASEEIAGVRTISLPKLIELKLASGMTNPGRLKDLADVQELIRALNLPMSFADSLNPFVQDKYRELWTAYRNNPQ